MLAAGAVFRRNHDVHLLPWTCGETSAFIVSRISPLPSTTSKTPTLLVSSHLAGEILCFFYERSQENGMPASVLGIEFGFRVPLENSGV